ncbi:MAG: hypothetical protein KZQ58_09070 [gamma proteobacterium symbiont of Bathyaustriella thionipta]|nr:hypothetical protein [gamma proteobacterium symbiont of Bathyaustriella thionipta]
MSDNPYQTPQSHVGNGSDSDYGTVHIFAFKGRLGRVRFIAYAVAAWLIVSIVSGVFSGLLGPQIGGMVSLLLPDYP